MGDAPKKPERMRMHELVGVCVGIGLLILICLRAVLGFASGLFMPIVHSKRSEVRANLKALYMTQQLFRQEKDRYGQRFQEIGFLPERGNRFAYFLQPSGPIELREAGEVKQRDEAVIIWSDRSRYKMLPAPSGFARTGCPITPGKDVAGHPVGLGVWGTYPDDGFIAAAAGDLDGDAELDCWSIASMPRVDASGNPIPAGVPYQEQDDMPPTRWDRIRSALFGPFFYKGP